MTKTSEPCPILVRTPIEEFSHRSSGSVVDLVSTIHVGSPSYFSQLGSHLARRVEEGFVILGEGIRAPSEEELLEVNLRDDLKNRLRVMASGYGALAFDRVYSDSVHFTDQGELLYGLDTGLGGQALVNADINQLDIARASSVFGLVQGLCYSYSFFRRLEAARREGLVAYDEAIYREIVKGFREGEKKTGPKIRSMDRAVLGERNRVVLGHLDGLLKQDEAAKAAIPWGYGHRDGLAEGLGERGYRCTRESYVTVAVAPASFRSGL